MTRESSRVAKGHSKGFTLIELLVVIAIIGILSSVVLASLSTARTKGKDASVQESMSSMRAAAEIYYSSAGDYGSMTWSASCATPAGVFADTTSNMSGLVASVKANATTVGCGANTSGWVLSATLPSGALFCVDSTGAAKPSAADTANYKCS